MKDDPQREWVPRVKIFAGKAAASYRYAKLIIKLINDVADVVNNDPAIGGRLKVAFLADYNVSLAEVIIPAADLSEQISTAGKEASGTGNMNLALNGALPFGTLDGANIEIRSAVGEENFFLFGLTADQVAALKHQGYRPRDHYERNQDLREAIDLIGSGFFSPEDRHLFSPLVDSLLDEDPYLCLADFPSYARAREEMTRAYPDQASWAKKALLNISRA